MPHQYEKELNKFFDERLKQFGYSHKSLHWESPFSQNARFIELLKILPMCSVFSNVSILDFGCGLGHMYQLLKESGFLKSWNMDYTGADINESFIGEAKKQFPEAKFRIKDETIYGGRFDFVVCSGVFNLKLARDFDIDDYYKNELAKLFNMASHGVAANFQSINALPLIPENMRAQEMEKFYFHDPEKVKANLKAITDKIKYADGYLPGNYDFTLYLLK